MIKEIHDREHWNQFLLREPTQVGLFSQSWEWLEFQEKIGRQVYRLGAEDGNGVCGVIKNSLPFGKSYFYSPRGPIFSHNLDAQRYHELFYEYQDSIRELNKERQVIFWRFEPMANLAALPRRIGGYGSSAPLEATSLHTRRGRYLIAPAHSVAPVQPKQTLIVDLAQNEDKILAGMHEKTRYNIRLALRRGVDVRMPLTSILSPEGSKTGRASAGPGRGEGEGGFENFWRLLQETAKRDGFKTHPRGYYEKMLQSFNNETMTAQLWLAQHDNNVIAGAIVGYFGDTATYLHGASSYKHRVLMAPYALHQQIMQDAKVRGYKWYDFWGIDEKKWPGMTRFKMGFGGKIIDYPGAFDLPLNKFWYKLYRIGRRIL